MALHCIDMNIRTYNRRPCRQYHRENRTVLLEAVTAVGGGVVTAVEGGVIMAGGGVVRTWCSAPLHSFSLAGFMGYDREI